MSVILAQCPRQRSSPNLPGCVFQKQVIALLDEAASNMLEALNCISEKVRQVQGTSRYCLFFYKFDQCAEQVKLILACYTPLQANLLGGEETVAITPQRPEDAWSHKPTGTSQPMRVQYDRSYIRCSIVSVGNMHVEISSFLVRG